MQSLRQDKALHTVKLQPHLKDVPDYIIPPTLKRLVNTGKKKKKFNREATTSKPTATQSKYRARASNPLMSLQLQNLKKWIFCINNKIFFLNSFMILFII